MTSHTKYIGVDLGGTHVRAAVVDVTNGEVSNLIQIATLAREGHDAVMDRIGQLVKRVIEQSNEHWRHWDRRTRCAGPGARHGCLSTQPAGKLAECTAARYDSATGWAASVLIE